MKGGNRFSQKIEAFAADSKSDRTKRGVSATDRKEHGKEGVLRLGGGAIIKATQQEILRSTGRKAK